MRIWLLSEKGGGEGGRRRGVIYKALMLHKYALAQPL